MISIEQALDRVLAEAERLGSVEQSLTGSVGTGSVGTGSVGTGSVGTGSVGTGSVGCVLAEQVSSDIDSPPHDKSLVDGYAICEEDLGGDRALRLLEEVTAGRCPTLSLEPGTTTRVMTGAPIPEGTAAVVMVEESREQEVDGATAIRLTPARLGQNLMARGTSLRQGEVILSPGIEIRPIEVGVLSEIGRARVRVFPRPRLAVIATGNELVPVDQTPGAGMIRNSNGPMLTAAATEAGAAAVDLGIGRDQLESLNQLVAEGLKHDVLVLSGGVSAGVLDLVPQVLQQRGVREVFHKVRLKPGKPLWFGVRESSSRKCLVFGLPGNPVSSLVCFELFVRAALAALAGKAARRLYHQEAGLSEPFATRGDRPTYHPARVERDDQGQWQARPLRWHGSADLRTLSEANGLIYFPPGTHSYVAGHRAPVYLFGPQ